MQRGALRTLSDEVRASEGVVHSAYERRVQQAERELRRVTTARYDYSADAQKAAAHGAKQRMLHMANLLQEAIEARDETAGRMAEQGRHEQARLGEARQAYNDEVRSVRYLLRSLEANDHEAVALRAQGALAQNRGKTDHFKEKIMSGVLGKLRTRSLAMCWAAWRTLVFQARTERAEGDATRRARGRAAKLEERLKLSERLRTEAQQAANEELEQAWAEALRWQKTAAQQKGRIERLEGDDASGARAAQRAAEAGAAARDAAERDLLVTPARPSAQALFNLRPSGADEAYRSVERLEEMLAASQRAQEGWALERDELRASSDAAARAREEAEAALAEADGRNARMLRDGVKREVAERVAALEATVDDMRRESDEAAARLEHEVLGTSSSGCARRTARRSASSRGDSSRSRSTACACTPPAGRCRRRRSSSSTRSAAART